MMAKSYVNIHWGQPVAKQTLHGNHSLSEGITIAAKFALGGIEVTSLYIELRFGFWTLFATARSASCLTCLVILLL